MTILEKTILYMVFGYIACFAMGEPNSECIKCAAICGFVVGYLGNLHGFIWSKIKHV